MRRSSWWEMLNSSRLKNPEDGFALSPHSFFSYSEALKEAQNLQVSDINPTLLGLYLNYSVFLYEITHQSEEARAMATKAFENAMKMLETLPEKDFQDSVSILQLIRDNLKLWESEAEH